MKSSSISLAILSIVLVMSTFVLAADKAEVDKERQEIRKRSSQILSQLYQAGPKANVQKAAGKGVAVDTKTKKETFMKMFEVQAGLGFGVKKFSLVWVFETPDALKTFIDSGLTAKGTKYYKDDDLNG